MSTATAMTDVAVRPSDPARVLAESHRCCRAIARRAARNFYYGFWFLPADQRQGMCALYAFLRLTDDYGDDPGRTLDERRAQLQSWSHSLDALLSGRGENSVADTDPTAQRVLLAMSHSVEIFGIEREWLDAAVAGVASDLEHTGFANFDALSDYCYAVAGTVGLSCLRIWRCNEQHCEPLAIACGRAFQLTNILRDLREDAGMDRCYVPQDWLAESGCDWRDWRVGQGGPGFDRLAARLIAQAQADYGQAAQLERHLHGAARGTFRTMFDIYQTLLTRIAAQPSQVLSPHRVRLAGAHKAWIAFRNLCCAR